MKETFAVLLDENMHKLDRVFAKWSEDPSHPLRAKPDPARFGGEVALIITQDSHNNVFAAVGCLHEITLAGQTLRFAHAERFTIPVVLDNALGRKSPLLLGKGFRNRFMYLAPAAAKRVLEESERLVEAPPIK